MLVDVETFLLYSLVNTYTYTLIYYLEDNVGNYYAVDDAYHGGYNLNPKLMPVAADASRHRGHPVHLRLLLHTEWRRHR